MSNKLSTGNPFLDKIIDGGVPLGSIFLLIEDSPTKLYQSFLKYSVAEGVTSNQKIFFYHNNTQAKKDIIDNLPYQSTQVDAILNSKSKEQKGEMKIAWRYENIQYANMIQSIAKELKYIFDLSRPLQDIHINKKLITTFQPEDSKNELTSIITNFISEFQSYSMNFTEEDKDKYTRVIIANLFKDSSDVDVNETNAMMNNLKQIARGLNGFIMITMSPEDVSKEIFHLIERGSDFIVRIKSLLMVSEKEKVGDYDGILYIEKRPSICTMKPTPIETDVYGMLRDKRKVVVEKIDIGVEVDRNTKKKEENKLDF